jgi:phage terminase large subunit-like protein
MTSGQQYCSDIINGKVNHGEYIKKLCEWHAYENSTNSSWEFNIEEAARFIQFIELLSLTKGEWAGKPFILEPWQCFIVEMIFGWVSKENGLRRFSEVTINIPKKNGKTEFAAALSLAVSWLDQEHGGQIFMAATSRDQAGLCFQTAKDMIKWNPDIFGDIFEPLAHSIFIQSLGASIKAISSEASTAEGKGASLVIFDEEHEQKDTQLRDNLRSGMAARRQPLFISISTAGMDKSKPYFKHLEKCKQILDGLSNNERHLVVIYTAEQNCDWEDQKVWEIANPNYGISVKKDFLQQQFVDAKSDPSLQPSFITKHLNIWSDSYSTWIDSKLWLSLGQDLKLTDFYGEEVYLGLDLGVTGDFSALSILIPKGDIMHLFMKFYIPGEMAQHRTKSDGLKFMDWARQGYINLTEGNATDFNKIKTDIINLNENFEIKYLSYDKAYASMLGSQLFSHEGINAVTFSQSIQSVTAPTKQFAEYILSKKLIHDNNPVMTWMMSNVLVYIDDANGNLKIHKGKSKNKVDGPCAAVNAIGTFMIDVANNQENDIIVC